MAQFESRRNQFIGPQAKSSSLPNVASGSTVLRLPGIAQTLTREATPGTNSRTTASWLTGFSVATFEGEFSDVTRS
jgi:hypothetical protein